MLSTVRGKHEGGAEKAIRPLRAEDAVSGALATGLRHGVVGLFIAYYETSRRRDRDGGPRITQDAVCGTLGVSDNPAVDVHLVKRFDPLRPRSEVELEAILDWGFGIQSLYSGADIGPAH